MASVVDLVEVELRDRAGEYLVRAGDALRADGHVELAVVLPLRVTATVTDDGVGHVTELTTNGGALAVRCDCPGGRDGDWCPHSVATAIEAWERAPKRSP